MHAALVLFESAQPEATNVSIYCAMCVVSAEHLGRSFVYPTI